MELRLIMHVPTNNLECPLRGSRRFAHCWNKIRFHVFRLHCPADAKLMSSTMPIFRGDCVLRLCSQSPDPLPDWDPTAEANSCDRRSDIMTGEEIVSSHRSSDDLSILYMWVLEFNQYIP